ncbi:MAG: PAS domain S-box protein [Desulfoprunum sp.]|nr:PAS domain S-box protein [Desulfoprunum sp.]
MSEKTREKSQRKRETVDWQKKYQHLEENIPGMVFSFVLHADNRYSFTSVSKASLELLGIAPEAMIDDASLFLRLIHPADKERYLHSVAHHSVTFRPWREDLRLVVNGEVRWYDCMARPEAVADGGVCWHGILFDITARKEAEKNQIRTNSLLDGIFSQNPYPLWISDRYGGLVRMNQACRPILEKFEDPSAGRYNVLLDRDIREQGFLSLVRAVYDEGHTAQFLLEHREPALLSSPPVGLPSCVFEVTVAPVKDEQGMVANAIIMYNDITERMRAEAGLRLTQFCIDQAALSIMRIEEPDGRVVSANQYACKSLGYGIEELCSMTVFDFDPTFTRESWLEHRHTLREKNGGTIETVHRRKDGTVFPVEVSINFLEYEGKTYSYSFSLDISERKKAEAVERGTTGNPR